MIFFGGIITGAKIFPVGYFAYLNNLKNHDSNFFNSFFNGLTLL